ncbi:MAG: NfeD family protein [Clostridia bacterium]|nr:NfeD family protein [Clostridia bacterium]
MMVYVWLIVLAAMVVLEIVTTQLVSVWFAVGALAAFLVALAGVEAVWIQIVVFVTVSAVAVAVTRPLVRKMVNRKAEPTNADMVIGKTGIVTDKIDNIAETGLVKVNGSLWTARTADGSQVDIGEKVKILEISGVKLIVEKEI